MKTGDSRPLLRRGYKSVLAAVIALSAVLAVAAVCPSGCSEASSEQCRDDRVCEVRFVFGDTVYSSSLLVYGDTIGAVSDTPS